MPILPYDDAEKIDKVSALPKSNPVGVLMKILLVYPRCPDTFWSFRHALRFVSKKAGSPPLGLLTVAALLPAEWEKRLVDMNVRELKDEDIRWADYVFLGAMSVQQESARVVIRRCKSLGAIVVAGGPLFTARHDDFAGEHVDHFVLNEAEITLPLFLADLANGRPQPIYTTNEWADVRTTPVPAWDLIRLKDYATMNLQYSRGCPYDCEFCDITVLYGRTPRTKGKEQVIAELESLYVRGWREHVFLVDDNFIGNKVKVKREILPAIIQWMQERGRPVTLSTEASLNLADDDQLLHLMGEAGFDAVFVGIETPNEASLVECGKEINKNRDLISCIRRIQSAGLEIQGGFIVGFDSDPDSIFDRMAGFIQESGIVTAMVGMLNAPRGTRLYERLAKEGRLLENFSGDNTDASMNFEPKMNSALLLKGYRQVLQNLYTPKHYYARLKRFLKQYRPVATHGGAHVSISRLSAFFKSIVLLGVVGKERFQYWKLFFWSLFRRPRLFPLAITHAIYGFHFRKVFEEHWTAVS
jgi:radical SAM superfamily enzyme YgiQ (UPF0313 family)